MPVIVTVLYPAKANFNMDWFLNKHLPMADAYYKMGMISTSAFRYNQSLYHTQEFKVGAQMIWNSMEEMQAAMESDVGKNLRADLPNYSDEYPQFLVGDVLRDDKGITQAGKEATQDGK